MRAMQRPMRPSPTRPSVLPDRSLASQRDSGQAQPSLLHRLVDRLEALEQRHQQREGAFGHRLFGVGRHVDHRDAMLARGVDVDGVDADAVLDDGLQLAGAGDHAPADAGVAHQQQVGVGDFARQLVLGRAIGQQHQLAAGLAQAGVDTRHFELAVGAHDLEGAWAGRSRVSPPQLRRSATTPATMTTAPVARCRPKRSFSTSTDSAVANSTEVSRSADTAATGARVIAHSAIQ